MGMKFINGFIFSDLNKFDFFSEAISFFIFDVLSILIFILFLSSIYY